MISIDELYRYAEGLEARITALENQSDLNESFPTKTKLISLREFINEKKPITANDRALTMGYYFEHIKGLTSFNIDTIKAAFREAKIPLPANVNDVINKNIGKALIMEAEGIRSYKKSWVLTASGEALVKKGFAK